MKLALFILTVIIPIAASAGGGISIDHPDLVLRGVPYTVSVSARFSNGLIDSTRNDSITIRGAEIADGASVRLENGSASFKLRMNDGNDTRVVVVCGQDEGSFSPRTIPGLLSILPPILAIILALTLRQVVVSLFAGVWLGAVFVFDYDIAGGFLRVLDHYIINALAQPNHISIVAFSMLFGGMVGVISKNGGTAGIAQLFGKHSGSPRKVQFITWLLGIFIFFDDYANSLIVGNTMRPITDKARISREKLAWFVDSTAAPVTSLIIVSTWVGYEVGLIDAALKAIEYPVQSAYLIFIQTLPFRFYPILALILCAMVIATGRDIFSMSKAERRARLENKLYRDGASLAVDLTDTTMIAPKEGTPLRWWNAAIPIVVVVAASVVGLVITGMQSIADSGGSDYSIGNIIGSADSYKALLWASLLSCVVAIVMSMAQRILTLSQALDAWFTGLKSMLLAMLILTMAWAIGQITLDLHTADYIVELLLGKLSPHLLPVLTFLVAAIISFATGTSWGTMGILMPLVIPLSVALSRESGLPAADVHLLLLGTVSSVLAGAVFGDHCSPISDTTILSSMASACDHVDHVKTQIPYALLAACAGMAFGDIPTAFGLSPYISIAAASGAMLGFLYLFGKKTPAPAEV